MKKGTNKTNLNFEFIDNEAFGNHLIMLYENAELGFAAKLRYLNNGLLKGEHAIFLTKEDPKDVAEKMSQSIDMNKFREKGLVHILQIQENISTSDEALKQFEEIIKIMEFSSETGFRLTGPVIENTSDKIGKKLRLLIEKRSQRALLNHKGSILCPYQVVKAKDNYEKEWMFDMFRKHTDVLYVPKSGQGTSFDSNFML